jgi:transcriptional regulator with XRE-family HTH domain
MVAFEVRYAEFCTNRHTERKCRHASLMNDGRTFGQRLRHYRLQAGFKNAKAFAKDQLGISGPSLSELENDKSKGPAPLTLLKAASALGLDPWHLLTGDGPPVRAVQHLRQEEIRLLMLYREVSPDRQLDIETEANRIHAEEHPVRSSKNPYPAPPPPLRLPLTKTRPTRSQRPSGRSTGDE